MDYFCSPLLNQIVFLTMLTTYVMAVFCHFWELKPLTFGKGLFLLTE